MSVTIREIRARQVLDCKARPMLEVDVYTESGYVGRGAAPTGTSVGMYEAHVLRDENPSHYLGLSVHKAVKMVEQQIAPLLLGMDVCDQRGIDAAMIALDGTPNKEKLGGNSIYSVSMACLRAAAAARHMPVYRHIAGGPLSTIPLPTFNVINGGRNGTVTQAFNEFMIAPWGAQCVEEAVEMAVEIHARLHDIVRRYLCGAEPLVGGSYGWAAPSNDPAQVLELMAEAVDACGYTGRIAYCLDCASSEMYDRAANTYELRGQRVSAAELIDCVKNLSERFPLLFVEDILDENDWENFSLAHKRIPRTNLIGDDLTVTNVARLQRAYELGALDGFILKPNQVGTITEALEAADFAKAHGLLVIPSGRSGGAVGDIVADFALGLQVEISKNGAPRSGERLDKINSLLRAASENPGSHLANLRGLARFCGEVQPK